jgi:hypothetical protein
MLCGVWVTGLLRDGLIAFGLFDRRRIKTQPPLSMQRCFICPRAGPRIARALHAAARAKRKKGGKIAGLHCNIYAAGATGHSVRGGTCRCTCPGGAAVSSCCITRAAATTMPMACQRHINVILQLWQRRRAGVAQLEALTHPMCP